MRRIFAVIGVMLCLLGLRLFDSGILKCGYTGTYTVYAKNSETVYSPENLPVLTDLSAYATRLDFCGGVSDALSAMENLDAKVIWQEDLAGLKIFYAYSKNILKSENLNGKKINVMVAVQLNNNKVIVGCPIIAGSY